MDLKTSDPEIYRLIEKEAKRQTETLDMIASENIAPLAVRQASGSVLTNKYAEGYPQDRYYGGCSVVDEIETLAIERATSLFDYQSANVQPHSGSQANAAVYLAAIDPGDKILGLDLGSGGHLTHGMRLNTSGIFYESITYGVDQQGLIDMDEVEKIAKKERPSLIIAGWSAYPREIDFMRFREIADLCGALLLADISHFSGLVAAEIHPKPDADFVTTTTHKTLGGPRGGLILTDKTWIKKINRAVFPGQQGGPAMQAIAGKAVAFKRAATPEFREQMKLVVRLAKKLSERLIKEGFDLATGGTDVHLVLIDLENTGLSGDEAEKRLEAIGIISNKNSIPNDKRSPKDPSGLRLGTASLASRKISEEEIDQIGIIIAESLQGRDPKSLSCKVAEIARAHPIDEV